MVAKEILNKQFDKAKLGGYKMEDVDDYLKEVSEEFAQLQKSNSELERKLEVLADKIREYRDDEEALKDALLIAQKQGNAIVAESKASAENITRETREKVEKLLAESKAKSERMINDANEYSAKTRADADAAAEKTINDANNKAAEIKAAMDKQQAIQESIIQQTRKEAHDFMDKLLACYDEQKALVESVPERCETDFVKRISEEVEKREQERKKAEEQRAAKAKAEKNAAAQQKVKEAAAAAKAEAAAAAKAEAAAKEAVSPAKPKLPDSMANSEALLKKPVQKTEKAAGVQKARPAEPAIVPERTAENNLPFFNSDTQTITKHENLQFGKNNDKK